MPDLDAFLLARIESANEAQKRVRLALFISTIATGTILAGLWNLYGSWDARWAGGGRPGNWTKEQVQIDQVRSWVDNNTVGIPLVGLKLSTSDAAITGTVVLLGLSLYQLLCVRRENEEIGNLLRDTKDEHIAIRRALLQLIAPLALLPDGLTSPIMTLDSPPGRSQSRIYGTARLRLPLAVISFLPVLSAIAILASDAYYALWYVEPFEDEALAGAWHSLDLASKWQLVLMDVSATCMIVIMLLYCLAAVKFRNATGGLLRSFRQRIESETASVRSAV